MANKKIKKVLDKPFKKCYNKYVKKINLSFRWHSKNLKLTIICYSLKGK